MFIGTVKRFLEHISNLHFIFSVTYMPVCTLRTTSLSDRLLTQMGNLQGKGICPKKDHHIEGRAHYCSCNTVFLKLSKKLLNMYKISV